ncbi:MAG: RNA polymerase sigma factor [Clostridia bacterium]|nr:RNA polymerase sigma factor [Clostridia bacterium]
MDAKEFNKLIKSHKSDKAAGETLCLYCLPVIKQHLSYQFRVTQDVEDLSHDIYLKILANPPKMPVIAPVAWLYKVTDNYMFTLLREVHPTYELAENISYEIDNSIHDNMMLEEALVSLDDPTRQVLILHDYYGYKLKDIGPMIGKTYDAVRQIHSRLPKKYKKDDTKED